MGRIRFPLLPRPVRLLGVVVALGGIVYFSLFVNPPGPPQPDPLWDKRLHVAGYATLAVVLAYATVRLRDQPTRRALLVFGGAVAVGAAIEFLQGQIAYRSFDWGDMLANTLGAALVGVWFLFERRVRYVRARRLARQLRESA